MDNPKPTVSSPRVLFGAFDRHNFGDLLFPHLMTALLPGNSFEFAGLVARDLRAFGGHKVKALGAWDDERPAQLIHVGGELLTCTAWQAAVMLLDPDKAAEAIARYDTDPAAAVAWAARQLGTVRAMPYVVGRDGIAGLGRLIFNAVGGVEWKAVPASAREAVKTALGQADWTSVRDHLTQAALRAEGLDFPLCPDPAVMVADCFGEVIGKHQLQDEVRTMRDVFPQGYLAVQFSADFGDDATLDTLARELSRVVAGTGLGLGRGTVGSSLHGRIVALAHGLPRVSLIPPQQGARPAKTAAFAETWEPDTLPRSVAVDEIERAVLQALAVPAGVLRENAASLRARYLQSQAQWAGLLMP